MPTTASALDLPFDEAIAFFRQKASVPTERWTDVYAAAHTHSYSVAGANTVALVDDFKAEIDKALVDGTTLAEFLAGFDQIVEKHGWEYKGKRGWRTRVIFDTNLRTAYSAGRYAQQTLPETLQAFPFWQYHHSGSKHPRLQHLAWDGLILRADDAFWTTNYPPNGWRCGCFTSPVSPGGLKRMGKARSRRDAGSAVPCRGSRRRPPRGAVRRRSGVRIQSRRRMAQRYHAWCRPAGAADSAATSTAGDDATTGARSAADRSGGSGHASRGDAAHRRGPCDRRHRDAVRRWPDHPSRTGRSQAGFALMDGRVTSTPA